MVLLTEANASDDVLRQLRRKWLCDPLAWHHDHWPKIRLAPYQVEIFKSIRDNRMTFCHSAAGIGKDFISARIMLWFFTTRFPAKVLGMSVTETQIEAVLWGEIDTALRTAVDPFGLDQGHLRLEVSDEKGQKYAEHWLVLRTARDVEAVQGMHLASPDGLPRVLWILDEASAIEDKFFDAAQSQADRILAIGNPLVNSGFFATECKLGDQPNPDDPSRYWRKVIHVDGLDSPNVRAGMEHKRLGRPGPPPMLIPGVLSYADYIFRDSQWDGYNKMTRLHGLFHQGEDAQLFPVAWMERAAAAREEVKGLQRGPFALGIDTASGGRDNAVFVVLDHLGIAEIVVTDGKDTTKLCAKAMELMGKYNVSPRMVAVDASGGKEIIADRLAEKGVLIRCVYFGQKPKDKKRFMNARSEMYGRLSEACNPQHWRRGKSLDEAGHELATEEWQECMSLDLHGDHRAEYEALVEELAVMPAWHDAEGRMYLPPKQRKQGETERKVTIHDLLGRSPDRADALVLAYWARVAGRRVIPRVDHPMAYSPEDDEPPTPSSGTNQANEAKASGESLADRLFGPAEPRQFSHYNIDWGDT